MTATHQYQIIGGPSREELFDALRLRHENRKVEFKFEHKASAYAKLVFKPILIVSINSVGIEDGSGNRWIITVYDLNETFGVVYLQGYYDTSTRKGYLKPIR